MNAINSQRVSLGMIFLAAFAFVLTIPQVWVQPVGDVLLFVVFGVITVDWIWLRVIQPAIERRSNRRASAS